jgi:tRNA modification GTPase
MSEPDVIVARASSPGLGVRALVRIAGDGCFALAAACSDLPPEPRRGTHRCRVRTELGVVPCLALVFPGPGSFTGEDSAELCCVGSPAIVAALEATLIAAGARSARPGEFALRAFVRGRIDLTQAEGIAATVSAVTDAQLRAARQLSGGSLGRLVAALAERVADDLALVEAGIDFTDEEDVVAIAPSTLLGHVAEVRGRLAGVLARAIPQERIEAVPRIALVGPPNVGKSTLFNALLDRPRAIASPIAGTTRDAIEERIELPGTLAALPAILVDLAGLDADGDGLNPAMQVAARAAIARADLLLRCLPPEAPWPDIADDERTLTVRMQSDRIVPRRHERAVSGVSRAGVAELRSALAQRLAMRHVAGDGEALVLSARHDEALRGAIDRLDEGAHLAAADSVRLAHPELVAAALRAALDCLGSISGAIAPDDVLGRIFGRFCIGK